MKKRIGIVLIGLVLMVWFWSKWPVMKPLERNEALDKSQAQNYLTQLDGIINEAIRRGRSLTKAELEQITQLQAKLAELGYEYTIPEGFSTASWQFAATYNPN